MMAELTDKKRELAFCLRLLILSAESTPVCQCYC